MDRHKILIVDDDPDLRKGLNLRLRANHYDTAYATDGFSAIAMAQKERPDLIILDIGLPAGDGFVVLERLQENAALSAIPVIVLTARDPEAREKRSCGRGPAHSFRSRQIIRSCSIQYGRYSIRRGRGPTLACPEIVSSPLRNSARRGLQRRRAACAWGKHWPYHLQALD